MKALERLSIIIALIGISVLVFSFTSQAQEYKLEKHSGHLFMNLTLNGKPALFIIDSGSTWSLIDISKSKEYKFDYIAFGDQKYAGIGGVEQIQMIFNDTIQETKQNFYGVNLAKMAEYIKQSLGVEITGIIGADFLTNNAVVLDYKNCTLKINN
jgi:hypothetical protein